MRVSESGPQLNRQYARLTAGALRTVQVESVRADESGPTPGVALDTAKDGLVWVLVNPQ